MCKFCIHPLQQQKEIQSLLQRRKNPGNEQLRCQSLHRRALSMRRHPHLQCLLFRWSQ